MSINILRRSAQSKGPFAPVASLWQWLSADATARKRGTHRGLLTTADLPSKQVFEAALCQSSFSMAFLLQIHPIHSTHFYFYIWHIIWQQVPELYYRLCGKYFLLLVLSQMSNSTTTLPILHRLWETGNDHPQLNCTTYISVVSVPG